jgi:SNF2 family DNA or RNA helicase
MTPVDTDIHAPKQVVLQKIMLRRLKTDEIDGKPLVTLPERRLDIIDCEFDRHEREFYDDLENRMEGAVERLMQQGSTKAYTSMLLLLLRLRQGWSDVRITDVGTVLLTGWCSV